MPGVGRRMRLGDRRRDSRGRPAIAGESIQHAVYGWSVQPSAAKEIREIAFLPHRRWADHSSFRRPRLPTIPPGFSPWAAWPTMEQGRHPLEQGAQGGCSLRRAPRSRHCRWPRGGPGAERRIRGLRRPTAVPPPLTTRPCPSRRLSGRGLQRHSRRCRRGDAPAIGGSGLVTRFVGGFDQLVEGIDGLVVKAGDRSGRRPHRPGFRSTRLRRRAAGS